MKVLKEVLSSCFSLLGGLRTLVCLLAFGFISGFPITGSLGKPWVKNPTVSYEATLHQCQAGEQAVTSDKMIYPVQQAEKLLRKARAR